MADILIWLVVLVVLAGLAVGGAYLYRTMQDNGGARAGGLFGPKPEKRLAVVEQAALDGRRRLVLIRRDGVEHLLMTGGPVDVVIETGIHDTSAGAVRRGGDAAPAVFSRQARPLGQAAGEG